MESDDGSEPPSETTPGEEIPLDVIPLHSTNLLTVLDPTGVIRYESPSIERVFGYRPDELVGEQVADYFHPDDRERAIEAFRAVVSSEEYTVESVEYRHERADGSYVWVESVGSANPTPGGHYVINTRDISDQKARERELKRVNERLDEFASIVGHDLRNPLNVAQGRLDLARERSDSEHLVAVDNALDRMGTLVDDMLTLARQGQPISGTERVTLSSVADRCWDTVATDQATLTVESDLAFVADVDRLLQLFENLFHNAVEHGSTASDPERHDAVKHGGGSVTIRVGELADETGFYVADDGPGIPKDAREEIFESGYSTASDGTGFGLAIVEEIVDAHGWDIHVTEGSAGGARFEITGVETDGG